MKKKQETGSLGINFNRVEYYYSFDNHDNKNNTIKKTEKDAWFEQLHQRLKRNPTKRPKLNGDKAIASKIPSNVT